ncbi:MAG: YbjN domain-containing protein [Minwuiales bacterium]|nr:YbjN domain-containing protein [Minwuiales bacterium]
MASLLDISQISEANPLDQIELFITENEWPCDRQGDDELIFAISGNWCDYQMWFSWRPEISALTSACAFEMKVPPAKQAALHTLIVKLNERMPLGHFDLWGSEKVLLFRQGLPLRGCSGPSREQIEDLVEISLSECERYFPAIQFVLWGGKSPDEAIEAAMLDTVGEA